jgi:hypothetical protein
VRRILRAVVALAGVLTFAAIADRSDLEPLEF